MQNQSLPILIFAQSARYIAQSAARAGFIVWAADCFADVDTLAVAQRHYKLPPFSQLSRKQILQILLELSAGEPCELICGAGIERLYSFLNHLPKNISLIGNTAETIHTLKTPSLFFDLLTQLALAFPKSQLLPPATDQDKWLFKPAYEMGGIGIHFVMTESPEQQGYYQQFIKGTSVSVLFVSNGINAQLISVNRQICSETPPKPFQLLAIETPYNLPHSTIIELQAAITKLTRATGLVGLNSLDLIIDDQGKTYLLEVNPRISASAQIAVLSETAFLSHYHSCKGQLPDISSALTKTSQKLYYLLAPARLLIPEGMQWPIQCHDIPRDGSCIDANTPICTLVLHGSPDQIALQQKNLSEQILKKLQPAS